MRTINTSGITPQRKIIGTNDKYGNSGIKNQQGSTVILYDTLPLDGRTEFRFFEGSAQRNFPLSNTGSQGNQLGVGSSMTVERAYLSVILYDADGVIDEIQPLQTSGSYPLSVLLGEFGFSVANSDVIKKVPVLSWLPQFNKNAENELNTSFDFDTQVVIPPLLEFVATVRIPQYVLAPLQNIALRLTIEGAGAIIAPRATF